MEEILVAQIDFFNPDFILCGIVELFGSEFIKKAKKHSKFKIVGQHQAPIPKIDLSDYDLILSSLPNLIEYFRHHKIHSQYLMLAADSRILKMEEQIISSKATFFGSLSSDHLSRCNFFKDLGKINTLDIWAPAPSDWVYSANDKITFHAPKFGCEMYALMKSSVVTLNFHIDMSGQYANNLRLFEAPACGTALLTDRKSNLHEIFEIGEEILCYESVGECSKIINFLTSDSDARNSIARKGKNRVTRDHTFEVRAHKLIELFESL
jgi:glycosyltransferase involved in cell wall biosynthesis